jgi:hypothetical protein
MRGGMMISTALRSIQRLFGRGPIPVSHVPISEAFVIEEFDPGVDPFGTLRSNASPQAGRNGPSSVGRNSSNEVYETSTQDLSQPSEATLRRDSATPESKLDDDRDAAKLVGDSGVDGHDSETVTRNSVMLISRNGRDFSLASSSSVVSVPGGMFPLEMDCNSIEAAPPTPVDLGQVSKPRYVMALL